MKFEELHNDKETNNEYLLNTVKESLNKGELCLFMSETGTFMSTGENDDTQFDIEQILLRELEALKEVREELSDVHLIEHGQQRKESLLN